MFNVSAKLENEAFQGDALTGELVRIMQGIVKDLEGGWSSGVILDCNGNRVGGWSAKPDHQEEK
jgi:hypothetical protein